MYGLILNKYLVHFHTFENSILRMASYTCDGSENISQGPNHNVIAPIFSHDLPMHDQIVEVSLGT